MVIAAVVTMYACVRQLYALDFWSWYDNATIVIKCSEERGNYVTENYVTHNHVAIYNQHYQSHIIKNCYQLNITVHNPV